MDFDNVPDPSHAALALEHPSVCLMCQLWDRHCWPQHRAPGQRCGGCETNALVCLSPEFTVLLFGTDASSILGIYPLGLFEGPIYYEGPEDANSGLARLVLRQVATLACAMPFPWALRGSDQFGLHSASSDNGGEIASGGALVPCLGDETMPTSTATWQTDWRVPGGYVDALMPENTFARRNTFTQPFGAHAIRGTYWNTVIVTISSSPSSQRYFSVPHALGADFVPREGILNRILQSLSPESNTNGHNVIFLEGLPGSGKTTVALNVAYEVRDRYPEQSVFWLSATSLSELQGSYRRIANVLGIQLYQDIATDHLQITQALEQLDQGRWLCIIDTEQHIRPDGSNPLWQYLPRSKNGTILIAGRSSQAAASLGARPENIINVSRMSDDEAVKLWCQSMLDGVEYGAGSTLEMIKHMGHSPLAIKKACSYIKRSWSCVAEAIRVDNVVTLLPLVNVTISLAEKFDPLFRLIKRKEPFAWNALCFMCYLDAAPIPLSLLPEPPQGVDIYEVLQRLKEYSFILPGEEGPSSSIQIDPIVQLSLRVWLKNENEQVQVVNTTLVKLATRLPPPTTKLSAEILVRSKFGLGLWAMDQLDDAEMQLRNCIMLSRLGEGQRPTGLVLCVEIMALFLKEDSRLDEAEFYRQGTPDLKFHKFSSFLWNLHFRYNCLDLAVQRQRILEQVHLYPCVQMILQKQLEGSIFA
uniref:NB-ARC domain-containing protein n=1 Tax=Bionectria ochroleuca TaxID=29856 RepID=A0A8H7N1V5_BIOOC